MKKQAKDVSRHDIKQTINTETLSKQLGLDPLIIDMLIDATFNAWDRAEASGNFPCIDGCTDCCSNAAITCTILEWEILQAIMPNTPPPPPPPPPNGGFGCPYKTKKGCAVYNFRPLVCRLFGYMVPYRFPVVRVREELAGEIFDWLVISPGYCIKKRLQTSMKPEELAEIMRAYKEIVDKTTIVIIGTFKDTGLNKGLATIDRFWSVKKGMHIWHRD